MIISQGTITITGVVKSILTCALTQVSPTLYTVKEVSNNPHGYTVRIETDGQGYYDGKYYRGDTVLTYVTEQKESVQIIKVLQTYSDTTRVKIACEVNE